MRNKRLIITSTISILLVSILLIGSTYSIFTSTEVDEKENVYTTGSLAITYTLSEDNVMMEDVTPTSIEDSIEIKPYRITVTNTGNVAYKFNVILQDTTATSKIDYKYIMTQVGKLEPQLLSNCSNNIIKQDIIILPNTSVDIDVRVWISDTFSNTEVGKSFYGKLGIDGFAVNTEETEIDNSSLIAELPATTPLLSTVTQGSYVAYTGNNDCEGDYCNGKSDNTELQGWRVAYTYEGSAYLISAGNPDKICTNNDYTYSNTGCTSSLHGMSMFAHFTNMDTVALKYCNSLYAYNGVCDSNSSWALNDNDVLEMTGFSLYDLYNDCVNTDTCPVVGNDLIFNGAPYYFGYEMGGGLVITHPSNQYMTAEYESKTLWGLRPVIKLAPTVYITGGTGTQDDPYTIAND